MKPTLIEALLDLLGDYINTHMDDVFDLEDDLESIWDQTALTEFTDPIDPLYFTSEHATRLFTQEEKTKLNSSAQGFLTLLERGGLLTHSDREQIIDEALQTPQSRIGRQTIKNILAQLLPRGDQDLHTLAWINCLLMAPEKNTTRH